MTHPLKNISMVELQIALSDTLQKLTNRACVVTVNDINFQESSDLPETKSAHISLHLRFPPDLRDSGIPF